MMQVTFTTEKMIFVTLAEKLQPSKSILKRLEEQKKLSLEYCNKHTVDEDGNARFRY